ncbi:hypothetical protein SteCoe_11480 [Stentor coeruleus]|uniref:Uncharacterized protein n=1 Tax=Stentor coeruleus TaxID=5963 RepID=A0A1R2CD67_9CILI|nr:hypothetical protein SteCoe_11480 [Stentor coeruleus]
MRRKKKFGVYSNKSIRKGKNWVICKICKSICKVKYDKAIVDPKSIAKNHSIGSKRRKLHQFGTGSLLPGRRFLVCHAKYYRGYSPPLDTPRFHKGKVEAYNEIRSQIKENDLEYELERSISKIDKGAFNKW